MKLLKAAEGVLIEVYVKPKAKRFEVKPNDEVVIFCREAPVKGRVNREIERELSKLFKKRVEIVSGFTSKKKRILIRNSDVEEVNRVLKLRSKPAVPLRKENRQR